MAKTIGVGMVGYKFMGKAHSNAFRQAPVFFDCPLVPELKAICGRDEEGVKAAAAGHDPGTSLTLGGIPDPARHHHRADRE